MTWAACFAVILTGFGVGCLYGSWRGLIPAALRPVPVGWLLLAAAVYGWIGTSGTGPGIALMMLAPAPAAWLLAGFNAHPRPGHLHGLTYDPISRRRIRPSTDAQAAAARRDPQPRDPAARPAPWLQRLWLQRSWLQRPWLRHLLRGILTIPLSAIASVYFSIACARLIFHTDLNQIVLAALLTPLLWGGAAWWALTDSRPARAAIGIAAAALLGMALAYLPLVRP